MIGEATIYHKLKGFKITAKQFRRNLCLRGASSQSNKSISKLQQRTLKTDTIADRSLLLDHDSQENLLHRPISASQTMLSARSYLKMCYAPQQIRLLQNENKRMNEYLGVIYKKMQRDADKIANEIADKSPCFAQNRKQRTPSTKFMKRLKINSIKVRKIVQKTQKNAGLMQIENKSKFDLNSACIFLGKLKKSQSNFTEQKNNMQKQERQSHKRYSSADKQKLKQIQMKKNVCSFKCTRSRQKILDFRQF